MSSFARFRRIPLAHVWLAAHSLALVGCPSTSSAPERSAAPSPAASPPPVVSSSGTPPVLSAPAGAAPCPPRPACDAPLPALGSPRGFRHTRSKLAVLSGGPGHRGRDLFVRPGGSQWVIGKFTYGPEDKDLEDEDIGVYLLRGCGTTWEKAGTYRTSEHDGQHSMVEGIQDDEGRIYVDLASATKKPLDVGRHRIRMVVAGDLTGADAFLEVLPPDARIAVSDVDGTLTTSETALFRELVDQPPPEANPGAAGVMEVLAGRGYYLFYLTARPEWFTERTREWLKLRGFPPGILHTTLSGKGAVGSAAAAFKSGELAALAASTGLVPDLAFGNKPSDVDTYIAAKIKPAHCYYFKLEGDVKGGVFHDDYRTLAAGLATWPQRCL